MLIRLFNNDSGPNAVLVQDLNDGNREVFRGYLGVYNYSDWFEIREISTYGNIKMFLDQDHIGKSYNQLHNGDIVDLDQKDPRTGRVTRLRPRVDQASGQLSCFNTHVNHEGNPRKFGMTSHGSGEMFFEPVQFAVGKKDAPADHPSVVLCGSGNDGICRANINDKYKITGWHSSFFPGGSETEGNQNFPGPQVEKSVMVIGARMDAHNFQLNVQYLGPDYGTVQIVFSILYQEM